MAKIHITLTEDLCLLIGSLYVQKINDKVVGVNTDYLYGGTYKYEQMAFILGLTDKAVEGTEEDIDGTKYKKEAQEYMKRLDTYIRDNIGNIEEIIHQFSLKGGISPGLYEAKDYEHIWTKKI